jgi:hypothetical protein
VATREVNSFAIDASAVGSPSALSTLQADLYV